MPTPPSNQAQIAAGLAQGVAVLSGSAQVTFTLYVAQVLPVDQTLFWVLSTQLSNAALTAIFGSNIPANTLTIVPQSNHHSVETEQREDETYGRTMVVVTTNQEIKDFTQLAPQALYLATIAGRQYSFSRQRAYYDNAGLFHYTGIAVEPAMASQVVDNISTLSSGAVVSNSLPYWLSINTGVPTFSSFLVPANTEPPYAVVHIEPSQTLALQAIAAIDNAGIPWQLVSDRVKITLYGLRNIDAWTYLQAIFNWFQFNDSEMGLMSTPVIRDEKRTQAELTTVAEKKVIEFQVSYYQTAALQLAQKLITHASVTVSAYNHF